MKWFQKECRLHLLPLTEEQRHQTTIRGFADRFACTNTLIAEIYLATSAVPSASSDKQAGINEDYLLTYQMDCGEIFRTQTHFEL